MQNSLKITAIGSGLVITLVAIDLQKLWQTIHVYNRSPDIRTVEFSGRSFNLVISLHVHRGLIDGDHVENFVDLSQNLMNE